MTSSNWGRPRRRARLSGKRDGAPGRGDPCDRPKGANIRFAPAFAITGEFMRTVEIYDTTLRDGAQSEDVSFSVEDKLLIAQKLDELGIHFIEGGWPGSNPRD